MFRLPLLLLLLLTSCSAKKPEPVPQEPDWTLHSVKLSAYPEALIRIDNPARELSVELPHGSKLGRSTVEIVAASGISTSPKSGEEVDLNSFKAIYLSAQDGQAARFGVTVTVQPSSSTAFSSLTEERYRVKAFPEGDRFTFHFPHGTDLKHLSFAAQTKETLSFSPDIRDLDLSAPRDVTVTAADGKTSRTIRMEALHYPQDTGVRGVYLPSPSHTGSFLSYSEVQRSVELLSTLHFNCLFVCAWAGSRVAWDSEVLLQNSTRTSKEAGNMYPKPGYIIFAAFQFGPEAGQLVDNAMLPGVTVLKVQMNTDLMTEDLKKKRPKSQSFWLVGQPDVELIHDKRTKDRYRVRVHGFDYYDVKTGKVKSGTDSNIAMWMLDTNYDPMNCIEPQQVFFPMGGKKGGWNKLAKTLHAEIDQDLIEQYAGNESLWFQAEPHTKVAVKIIDDRGIESLRVLTVEEDA